MSVLESVEKTDHRTPQDDEAEQVDSTIQTSDSHTGELSLDVIFELLMNWRRRQTLRLLEAKDGQASLDELAEVIAAKENDIPEHHVNSEQRKRVYIGLYQSHLPKMNDAGIIDYEQRSGTVTVTAAAEPVYRYLNYESESTASNEAIGDDTTVITRVVSRWLT